MSIDMAQFHQVFFEESFEGLDIMENGLLNMDVGEVEPEEINGIFRAAHSIKGGSGTFGFTNVSEFTHVMETLLDEMRDGRRSVTREAVNVLLASVDVLRDMLTAAQDGDEPDQERVSAQHAELQRLLAGTPAQADPDQAGPSSDGNEGVDAVAKPVAWKIVFRPHQHLLRTGNDPLRIIRELAGHGELVADCDTSGLPSMDEFEPEDSYLSWDLRLNAAIPREEIEEVFEWIEDECDFALIPILPEGRESDVPEGPAPQAATGQEVAPPAPELKVLDRPPERRANEERRKTGDRRKAASAASSIRVDTGKIDSIINMVGELVITQSMLGLLGEDFHMDKLDRLREGLGQMERHTRELQESVMQIRMLPISFTFSRFPRLVHDLSQKLGKKIELQMSGENTEVDKTVIEKIGDPLVHLVRNSVDHGIEMPEDRVAAGKPETGTVHLSAEHRGGNIVIEISDDGKGLARDTILRKGIDRGLVREEDSLTDKQIYELIFQPGFSTAEQVSDVSGRGVGMDVVRRNINELGGSIEIDSQQGRGSTITIRLPLTLAILDGQTISIGDEIYIVPLVSIIESIQVNSKMLQRVAGRGETFRLRDEYLPIVRMSEVFGIQRPRATGIEEGIVVVVESGGAKCGLFVDGLLGQQQVVIKSLESNYGRVPGLSGATILGDGSVALILDIPGVMRLAAREPQRAERGMSMSA